MASKKVITVASPQELDSTITKYISKGFTVANRGTDNVVMFQKKQFSILMAIIGFFLAVLPLIIYIVTICARVIKWSKSA